MAKDLFTPAEREEFNALSADENQPSALDTFVQKGAWTVVAGLIVACLGVTFGDPLKDGAAATFKKLF